MEENKNTNGQRRRLLVMVIPAIVLVAAAYLFFQQSLSASRAVGELEAAQAEIERLESESADLASARDQLERDLASCEDLREDQSEELQSCKGEVARLRSEQIPMGGCVFMLGEVNPIGGYIAVINRSTEPLDLAGWSVSDGEGEYTFPAETVVPRFGAHRMSLNTYNPGGDPEALFLSSDSDEVFLRDPDGQLCDQASW